MSTSIGDSVQPSSGSKRRFESIDSQNEVQSTSNMVENALEEQTRGTQPQENRGDSSKLKSKVWKEFKRIQVDGRWKAECHYCKKLLGAGTNNGTSHLIKHLASCQKKKELEVTGPTQRLDDRVIENHPFDQAAARNKLGKMIILHEYPLSMVEHHGFKDFCGTLQPLFKVVSRNTIKSDILKIYEHEKNKTRQLLNRNTSRFAITTDMWTSSNNKRGFMAITAHFVDDTWTLQSRIVRFIYVPSPHTADVLAKVLVECLVEWNLDRRLSTLTVDNCSTNDAMINILLNKLPLNSLWLRGKLFHMRCSAHILNLIVKEGLGVIGEALEKVRDSVSYWTATPKRCETFRLFSQNMNISTTKNLSLDCKTRWNSTYLMLQSALPYKDVFPRLKQWDLQYKCLPLEEDWKLAKEICERLKLFYEATLVFSGSSYPTANQFFPKICKIKASMGDWALSSIFEVRLMATNMATKFEKYWSSLNGVMALGIVLDPRYKLKGLEFYFTKIYDGGVAMEIEKVRIIALDLLKEYQQGEGDSENLLRYESSQSQTSQGDEWETELTRFISNPPSDGVKSEFDMYLEDAIVPRGDNSFDILVWWKSNIYKYPTLSCIARDILSVPVSTVASESAFSTSGRFLSPHRSRLHSDTLEALMCAQDWLWSEIKGTSSTPEIFKRSTINDDDEGEEISVEMSFEEL